MKKTSKLYYGAAYYDEYMPCSRLQKDMDLMRKAEFNLIRIAESTWSTWEPNDGEFDFTHLHRMLKAAQDAGIDVIVGTPTYAIPPWLARKYPDILAVTHHGQELYGHRQNMDITHPGYLFHAERIIRRLMKEIQPYTHVIGIQIDNETKHYDTCSPRVQQMFCAYLKKQYPDIQAFNAEFGLNYWSNRVQDWADLPDIRGTINGSLGAEFKQLQRNLVTEFFHWQEGIIRTYLRPDQLVTHNFDFSWRNYSYGYQPDVNQYDAAQPLDIAGCDIYHPGEDLLSGAEIAFGGDVARSLKKTNYLVLETQAQGNHGWLAYPGQLRLQAFSHLAGGADCVEYWHWHSIHNAIESYWKGVLSHNLKENATYRECMSIGADFARLSNDLLHLSKHNRIAMMMSNRSNTAFTYFPAGSINDQNTVVRWLYDACYRMNLEMDCISDTCAAPDQLAAYDLIILPSVYSMSKELITSLDTYVKNGGHLLASFRSAFADEHLKIYADDQPYGLTDCFGITYDQFTDPGRTTLSSKAAAFEKQPVLSDWMELLIPKDTQTEVIANYDHPYWNAYAAVTHHPYGKGSAAYIGCFMDNASLEVILKTLMERFHITVSGEHFPLIRREGINQNGEKITYFFNYSNDTVSYTVPYHGTELIGDTTVYAQDTATLKPWGFHILKKDPVK